MGSFDVACSLTNLTIGYGEETGFVFLTKNQPRSEFGKLFCYSTDLHMPFLPPMFGVYDDYGYLRDIEDCATKRYLEKRFNQPVENLIKMVNNYGRSIYSTYGPIFEFYPNKIKDAMETRDPRATLLALGFTHVEGGEFSFGRYTLNLNDRRGMDVTMDAGVEDVLDRFAMRTGIVPGFDPEDWTRIVTLRNLSGMYVRKDVFMGSREFWKDGFMSEYVLRHHNPYDEMVRALNSNPMDFRADSRDRELLRQWFGLESHEYKAFMDAGGVDDVAVMVDLHNLMGCMNRLYLPTAQGQQHGNDPAHRKVLALMMDVLDKEAEDNEEDL